jgi:hypothetical protein
MNFSDQPPTLHVFVEVSAITCPLKRVFTTRK